MAVVTTGIDELQASLKDMIEMPDSVVKNMLESGADIIAKQQKATMKSMGIYDRNQKYPSKHVSEAAVKSKKIKKTSDGSAIYVYPQGSRTRAGTTTRQAEIAFINEYGKAGQAARPAIRTANERCADKAIEAAADVYDDYLKSKNL